MGWRFQAPARVDGGICWRVTTGEILTADQPSALALADPPAELDWDTLRALLSWSWPAGTQTPFIGVHRLPAGAEARVMPDGSVELARRPVLAPEPASSSPPVDVWAALVAQCASLMSGSRRTAVMLSGGIDSSAVAAAAVAAARRLDQPTPLLLSARYPGLACDEAEAQARVAAHLGAAHASVDGSAIALFPAGVDGIRESLHPLVDGQEGINLALYRIARDEGCDLVLTGVGGDEVFEGQGAEVDLVRSGQWLKALRLIEGTRRARSLSLVPTYLRRAVRLPVDPSRSGVTESDRLDAGSWSRALLRRVLADPGLSWRLEMARRTARRAGLRLASPFLGDAFLSDIGRMPWFTLIDPPGHKGRLRAAAGPHLPGEVVRRVRKARFDAYYRHRLAQDAAPLAGRYADLSQEHRIPWLSRDLMPYFQSPATAAQFLTGWMALGILEFVAAWAAQSRRKPDAASQ